MKLILLILLGLTIGCSTAKVKYVKLEQKYVYRDKTVVSVDDKYSFSLPTSVWKKLGKGVR
jgi:hypothetical protein